MLILKKLKKISNTQKIGRVRICLEYINKQILKNKTLVDIGSSFGWLEQELVNTDLDKVIGIEPNDKALKIAKKNCSKATFLKGNAIHIPVKNKNCDIAVLFDVIEHVPVNSEKKVLKEINRVLKSGGILLLSTPFNYWVNNLLDPAWYFGHRHYSENKLINLLKSAGFQIKTIEVRGKIWASFYMIFFYINKWLFKGLFDNFKWIEEKYDNSYNGKGCHTIYLTAIKT